MTEVDKKNNEIIKGLIERYFSLREDSLEFVKVAIDSPFSTTEIDELFKDSTDNRIKIKIEEKDHKKYDMGWEKFKEVFHSFKEEYKMVYKNFKENRITINKNEFKLLKALTNYYYDSKDIEELKVRFNYIQSAWSREGYSQDVYYSHWGNISRYFLHKDKDEFSYNLNRLLTTILEQRFVGDKDYYAVLTRNFADWFLCSTNENWESCLSLNSEYVYWSGLPGLLGDPNRLMLYITNGEKKEYEGIKVDKILGRTWLVQDEHDVFHHLKWYPQKVLKNKFMSKCFNIKVPEKRTHDWRSKDPIEIIRFEDKVGYSSFIYQDLSGFMRKYDKFYIEGTNDCEMELICTSDNDIDTGGCFSDFQGGLWELIERGTNLLTEEFGEYEVCYHCDDRITGEEYYINSEPYCYSCFNSCIESCLTCGCEIDKTLRHETFRVAPEYAIGGKEYLCQDCFDENVWEMDTYNHLYYQKEDLNFTLIGSSLYINRLTEKTFSIIKESFSDEEILYNKEYNVYYYHTLTIENGYIKGDNLSSMINLEDMSETRWTSSWFTPQVVMSDYAQRVSDCINPYTYSWSSLSGTINLTGTDATVSATNLEEDDLTNVG